MGATANSVAVKESRSRPPRKPDYKGISARITAKEQIEPSDGDILLQRKMTCRWEATR